MHYLDFIPSSTLHETNSSHLEMDGWNTCFLLEWPYAVTSISSGLALCSPSAFPPVRHQKILDDEGIPPLGKWESAVSKRCGSEIESKKETLVGEQPCWVGFFLLNDAKTCYPRIVLHFRFASIKNPKHFMTCLDITPHLCRTVATCRPITPMWIGTARPDAQKDAIVAWGLGSPVFNGT